MERPEHERPGGGLIPTLPARLLRPLLRLPPRQQALAARALLRGLPLDPALRDQAEDELARCWDGVPLIRPIPELVDQARGLALLEAAAGAAPLHDGPRSVGRWLQVDGLPHLDGALGGERGAVLLVGRFGAWRWIAPALRRRGYAVELLDLRAPGGLLASSGYARPLVRFAQGAGNVLVVVADEAAGLRPARGTLLGRRAQVAALPYALGRAAQVSLLPAFAVREPRAHRLVIEPALSLPRSDDPESDRDAGARRWLGALEHKARRHPEHYVAALLRQRLMSAGSVFDVR